MPPPGFDLFLSYVRADSRRVLDIVPTLKRALESHRHPDDRRRRFRVCTDVDDLELAGTVSQAIRDKIAASRQLLVLCTSSAPRRPYVREEIDVFRETHPGLTPIGAFVDLEPAEAFPDVFPRGAIGADLHPLERARDYRGQIERESHKIVAEVWDVPLRRVHDRFDAERRTMRRRIAGAVIASAAAVALGVVITAGRWGLHPVRELPLREDVVAPAAVAFSDRGRRAVLVDDRRLHLWSLDGAATMRNAPAHAIDAHVFDDGRVLVLEPLTLSVIDSRGLATRIDPGVAGPYEEIAVSAGRIAVVTQRGELAIGRLGAPFRRAPRPVTTILRWAPEAFRETGPLAYGDTLAWSGDGTWLASATGTGQLIVLQPESGRFLRNAGPIVYETEDTRPIGGMIFLGQRLLFAEGTLGLRSVDLATGAVERLALPQIPLIREFQRMDTLLVGATSETLEIFDIAGDGLRWRQRVTLAPKNLPRTAVSPDGRWLLVGYFDAPPDLFRWTWRVFGVDLWTR